jgi:hypothetical protein
LLFAAGALLATLRQRVGRLNRHLPAKVVFYWRYNRRYLLTGRAAKS